MIITRWWMVGRLQAFTTGRTPALREGGGIFPRHWWQSRWQSWWWWWWWPSWSWSCVYVNTQVHGKHEPHRGCGGQDEDGLLLRKQPRTQRDQGMHVKSVERCKKWTQVETHTITVLYPPGAPSITGYRTGELVSFKPNKTPKMCTAFVLFILNKHHIVVALTFHVFLTLK